VVLIGYWPLNESSGSIAYDYSGNEKTGEVTSGNSRNSGDSITSTSQGVDGLLAETAYEFDVDGYVDVTDTGIDGSKSATITGWIKSTYTSDWNGPFGYEGDGDNNEGYLIRYHDTDNAIELNLNGGSYNVQYGDVSSVYDGKWHLLTGVWTGSRLLIYVDGEAVASSPASATSVSAPTNFNIGRYYWIHADDHWGFEGRIAEVRVYNHALTPAEVQYLYNVSKRGRQVSSEKQS
jgi:hypothetical protein